eukprot:CAMPEP_0172161908 /NCGR_PEP_ID=MMETSP1050-20130122/6378_1 /TAXON_ID=233186 /ORGANISM="Cryptomonas curvata, Strain CCAP979/52" /LENGTH=111 /DNA_ID=CAMNT_0012831841 /DNA_START=248 /DNA_END=579 /DNA_ORIENTATION=+
MLQSSHGFVCARTRKRSLASSAGNWLFCNRRWLDPRDADDLCILEREYMRLCSRFPRFAACCQSRFLDVLTDVCSSWTVKTADSPHKAYASSDPQSPTLTPPTHGTLNPAS